jgi:hypothetical protein
MKTSTTTPGGCAAPKRATAKPTLPQALPPPPDADEAAQIDHACKRVAKRVTRFAVTLAPINGVLGISAGHSDVGGWSVRAAEAFGTRSQDFSKHMLERICHIAKNTGAEQPTEVSLNAALAFIDGYTPDNEIEAMGAMTLYAINDLALTMVIRAKQATDVMNVELSGNLAVKLMRAATAQMEALAKLRRGGEQTVRVEHVTVHAGGQAIVGVVGHDPGGAGAPDFSGVQPHAKPPAALTHADAPFDPLRSAHPERERVPISRDA